MVAATHCRYPGRVLALRYEDVVSDLPGHADLVYRFLGVDGVPHETRVWIDQNRANVASARTKAGYQSPVDKWTKRLAAADGAAIVGRICRQFFRLVGDSSGSSRRPTSSSSSTTLARVNVSSGSTNS